MRPLAGVLTRRLYLRRAPVVAAQNQDAGRGMPWQAGEPVFPACPPWGGVAMRNICVVLRAVCAVQRVPVLLQKRDEGAASIARGKISRDTMRHACAAIDSRQCLQEEGR